MSKPLAKLFSIKRKFIVASLLVLLLVSATIFISANLVYGRVFPNFSVNGVSISSKTIEEAKIIISENFVVPDSFKLITKDEQFEISSNDIDFSYNIDSTVIDAYSYYRNGSGLTYSKGFLSSLIRPHNIDITYELNNEKLLSMISAIAAQVENEPVYPSARIENGEVIVIPGDKGTRINRDRLIKDIQMSISKRDFKAIPIEITEEDPRLSDSQREEFRKTAENLSEKNIVLNIDDESITLNVNEILPLVYFDGKPNKENLNDFITTFSQNNNKDPQNSVFEYVNGAVVEFIPSSEGVAINGNKLLDELTKAISELSETDIDSIELDVPLRKIPPEITTEEVNDLGINELIGKGSSNFKGSISSRIHNIGVASTKFNGTLVEPGEVLSFNNVLGDVSEFTGYKKAYVIRDGQTVLGDGGGVCQVSTTLFRAALDAGLPIVERRSHSYRVTYYEQGYPPGLDATVYSPTTDLKFKNDTPGHLLIQTSYDPTNAKLDFEIYGTDDGRTSSMTKPVITSSSPPPEALYIDDPTLPEGQVKQIDWSAWGAKVNFDYSVERDGEVIYEKTFYSNFQPWQAKYLRGTAPVN